MNLITLYIPYMKKSKKGTEHLTYKKITVPLAAVQEAWKKHEEHLQNESLSDSSGGPTGSVAEHTSGESPAPVDSGLPRESDDDRSNS